MAETEKNTKKRASSHVTVYEDWHTVKPLNQRRCLDILSDGILKQKEFSAAFDDGGADELIPLESIERINIFSNVAFDNGFLEKAAACGIYINVFGRDYSFMGRFTPAAVLKDPGLTFEQLTAYYDKEQRLYLAKQFVLASVHNLRLNIRYYRKHDEENGIYNKALNKIEKIHPEINKCEAYEELLLIEARIRAAYYDCFDSFIRNKDFAFVRRSKRPPLNAVNSMISFGNTVLYNYIATEIYKSSLDIRLGFLHASNRRAESLNLDIAEIFRPLIVDRITFTLINRNEIKPDCFEEHGGGIYLNNEGKRLFLRAFYEKLNSTQQVDGESVSYAELIKAEIQKLTRLFRSGEKYKAFRQVR